MGIVSITSLLNFGLFWFHINALNIFSMPINVSCLGDGRDSRTCVILDINKLFTITIFPYGVKFLAFHRQINFCISPSFRSRLELGGLYCFIVAFIYNIINKPSVFAYEPTIYKTFLIGKNEFW